MQIFNNFITTADIKKELFQLNKTLHDQWLFQPNILLFPVSVYLILYTGSSCIFMLFIESMNHDVA